MFRHYLKIFSAQFLGNKTYSLINVFGLAAGLTCFLLIMLFVRHELSFDDYHDKADSIYRVSLNIIRPDGVINSLSSNLVPLAPLLEENFPEIREAVRLTSRPGLVNRNEEVFNEDGIRLVDENFFTVFDAEWLQGSPDTALMRPDAIVLTESMASKYFGATPALGGQLLLYDEVTAEVTGVIADLPSNTHLTGTLFAPQGLMGLLLEDPDAYFSSWNTIGAYTYIELEPGAEITTVANRLPAFVDNTVVAPPGLQARMTLTPLTDIYMASAITGDLKDKGSMAVVGVFSAIAFSILMIACINFMNISTARSTRRAREVGLRKSLGASRSQLVFQFMGEAVILFIVAMVISVAATELLVPVVTSFLNIDITLNIFGDPMLFLLIPASALALGLLAGWYPALFLSAFQPALVFKSAWGRADTGKVLRSFLVILQFTVSIVLLVASVVFYSQMRHTDTLDPGFDSDGIVVVPANGIGGNFEVFRNLLIEHPDIAGVSSALSTPLRLRGTRLGPFRSETDTVERTLATMPVDIRYFSFYNIELLAGRGFSSDLLSDRMAGEQGSLVLNASAAQEFGWTPASALGRLVTYDGQAYPVIGVVADTIQSARQPAEPIVYTLPESPLAGSTIAVKIRETNAQAALAHIDASWNAINPGTPITRYFLDDTLSGLYEEENRQMNLTFWFSAMSILISCLGLYGLATFNTENRTKEIGVRKVMGSSVWQIILLLTNDFSKLVLLSNIIAWPVAYFAMNRWLENFAYRIDLTPMIFIGSGLIALCIAWVTVGGTAAKAASQKPVLALRYE